jgi:hypothetical protein
LVEDLISPLEKQIKEQLADQTKKPPAATPSGPGGTTRTRVVAKKAGGSSHKGTEKGKKRASPPAETVEERGRNKRSKSVVELTCNEALDTSAITNCHPSTAVNRTMTAEENERITNERDLNDSLHYAHQGVASAVHSGSNDRTNITKTFDDRVMDLQAFKEEHGHCNVLRSKSDKIKYKSLGRWCSDIRQSYTKIKQGKKPSYKLSDDNIQRLERMGFDLSLRVRERISFDDRVKDLQAFKEEHGHCNVPVSKSDKNAKYKSLGVWCSNIRYSYKMIKQGGEASYKLSDADIQRLERMGFDFVRVQEKISFDDRVKDLQAFKEEHGHCNVPKSKSDKNAKYQSLGVWCSHIRCSFKTIKQGGSPHYKLSDANIQRLERMGFDFVREVRISFDDRVKDLQAFKEEHGHCNVPISKSEKNIKYQSLGFWCSHIRCSFKKIKHGQTPPNTRKLSDSNIQRLERMGFDFVRVQERISFDDRVKDLQAFKDEHGHCNVPKSKSDKNTKYQSLGFWCSNIRQMYNKIKQGQTPPNTCKLSDANIQRLEAVGFKWNLHEKK